MTSILFVWFREAIALKLEYMLQKWYYCIIFFWNKGRCRVVSQEKLSFVHTTLNDKL